MKTLQAIKNTITGFDPMRGLEPFSECIRALADYVGEAEKTARDGIAVLTERIAKLESIASRPVVNERGTFDTQPGASLEDETEEAPIGRIIMENRFNIDAVCDGYGKMPNETYVDFIRRKCAACDCAVLEAADYRAELFKVREFLSKGWRPGWSDMRDDIVSRVDAALERWLQSP
jgi:hypothetical protein